MYDTKAYFISNAQPDALVDRSLAVCLSVTLVDCIQTAKDIIRVFLGSILYYFSVFVHIIRYKIPKETLSWSIKYTGSEIFSGSISPQDKAVVSRER